MITTATTTQQEGRTTRLPDDVTWEDLGETAVVLGIDEEEYHAVRGVCSASQLKTLDRSTARHLAEELLSPPDTAAFRVGRALHCGILEPEHFDRRFAVAPKVDRRTKAGKAEYAEFEAAAGDATHLTQKEGDQVEAMIAAINAHPAAESLLDACTIREATLLATLQDLSRKPIQMIETPLGVSRRPRVPCKARVDAMSPDGSLICDIKTTSGLASRKEMEMASWRFGYGLQMCMYREMMRANGADVQQVTFIAVEKTPPYGVSVFVLTPEVMDLHQPRLLALLKEWNDTIGSGIAPCWSEKPIAIGVPDWARKDLEIEAEMAAATGGAA